MKYSPKNYALALAKSLEKAKDEKPLISNFLKLVKKNGDQKSFPKILEAFKKIEIKKNGGSQIKIEFAREASEAQIKSITKKFSRKDWIETSLNPSLVAGVRITFDDERELDGSLNRKLHKLFK
ncbi:MAG: F0F1 ATP synthase subunit delta [Candidatus Liptonbacteria bacterium]|nr:F0F1 ATP synthase subunit delta [Candidatus Liptonbacteria bacterium]